MQECSLESSSPCSLDREAVGIRGTNNLGVSWPGVSHKSWKATAREKKKTLFLPLHVGFWSENLRDTKFEKLV